MESFFTKVQIFRFWPKTMDYNKAFWPKLSSFFVVLLLRYGRCYKAEICVIQLLLRYPLQWNHLMPKSKFSPLPLLLLLGGAVKFYSQVVSSCSKVWGPYLDCVMRVGQIQLIRRQIANELNRSCKFDSKLLSNSLHAFNQYATSHHPHNLLPPSPPSHHHHPHTC